MALVDMSATMLAPCEPPVLFAEVEDLGSYPAWLTIVPRAGPFSASSAFATTS